MGDFKWSYTAGYDFGPPGTESLLELVHENSKLFPATARAAGPEPAVSEQDLHLMSRGFRNFRGSPKVGLPEPALSSVPLSAVMQSRRSRRAYDGPITIQQLATLLGQALGPTAVAQSGGTGVMQAFRSWPSAGGLYPIDVYIASSRVDGVDPGLYYYGPIQHELNQLRVGSPEGVLREAYFFQDYVLSAAAVVLLVASFDRTAAKYGEARAYRLVLLDAGHAAQNILLTAEQEGLAAVAVQGFCDDILADYLGLDGLREAVVHSVVVGCPT